MRLAIANKLYSSWSMRPWLVLRAFGVPFKETAIRLKRADTAQRIAAYSPAGKLPILIDGDVRVWESLAIIEYLAEKFPDKAIWPRDMAARAQARAISSEMHAGFQALRQACAMNLGKRFAPRDHGPEVAANVARVVEIWREARGAFGAGGPFLYGAFSAADAMYAPVVTRFVTYGVAVDDAARSYMDAVLGHPAVAAWREDALAEPWTIAEYEADQEVIETFPRPAA